VTKSISGYGFIAREGTAGLRIALDVINLSAGRDCLLGNDNDVTDCIQNQGFEVLYTTSSAGPGCCDGCTKLVLAETNVTC
jgi:hypothetical protein